MCCLVHPPAPVHVCIPARPCLFLLACRCVDLCCVCNRSVSDRTCYEAGSRWRPWPTSGTKKFGRDPPAPRTTTMRQKFFKLNRHFQFIWKQWMDIVCPWAGRVCVCVRTLFFCHNVYVTKEFPSVPTVEVPHTKGPGMCQTLLNYNTGWRKKKSVNAIFYDRISKWQFIDLTNSTGEVLMILRNFPLLKVLVWGGDQEGMWTIFDVKQY